MKRIVIFVVFCLALVLVGTSSCVRPYDRPEYVEIDTSETGFLIPLEGDVTEQVKFQSEDFLKQHKVAAKRVQITHRWSQEGRMPNDGRWIPTVRLVKVNRSPITREWATTQTTLANGPVQRSDKAIWIESGDSVGFSMGFTCTAFIPEDDAARFLYWYPSGSLAEVMDREVRGRVQVPVLVSERFAGRRDGQRSARTHPAGRGGSRGEIPAGQPAQPQTGNCRRGETERDELLRHPRCGRHDGRNVRRDDL